MMFIAEELQNYVHVWPFLEPVSIEDVTDYYDIIKDPMGKLICLLDWFCIPDWFSLDLATLEENVKADTYPAMEGFIVDTQKIFDNCRLCNGEDTEYARYATKLERFFNEKLRAATRTKMNRTEANYTFLTHICVVYSDEKVLEYSQETKIVLLYDIVHGIGNYHT